MYTIPQGLGDINDKHIHNQATIWLYLYYILPR